MIASTQSEKEQRGRWLIDCVRQGALEQARALLLQGVDLGRCGDGGRTAVHFAAAAGRADMVRLLLEFGGNTELPAADGSWPVHDAARSGNIETLLTLVKAGASLQAVDQKLHLAAHYAARAGSLEMLREIHLRGGLLHKGGWDGETPLSLAVLGRHYDAARFIAENGGKADESLLYLADMRGEHIKQIQFLLNELGADPECETSDGWRPALLASVNGRAALLEILLRHPRASRDTVNLSLACLHRHGKQELECIPLSVGADPRIPAAVDRLPPDLLWEGVPKLRRALVAELMAMNLASAMPFEAEGFVAQPSRGPTL